MNNVKFPIEIMIYYHPQELVFRHCFNFYIIYIINWKNYFKIDFKIFKLNEFCFTEI